MRILRPIALLILGSSISCTQTSPTFDQVSENISKTAGNFWIKKFPEEDADFSQQKNTNDQNDPYNRPPQDENSAVELMWLVPEGRVTKYQLNYGTDINKLSSSVEIKTNTLASVMHPRFGKVFKYVLMGVPPRTKIFYTLQAGNEFGFSEPTPPASELSR